MEPGMETLVAEILTLQLVSAIGKLHQERSNSLASSGKNEGPGKIFKATVAVGIWWIYDPSKS
jgi:hypothetical protein